MTTTETDCDTCTALCLRITADADPGALTRILGQFQNLNVLPRRISADLSSVGVLHIRIELTWMREEQLSMITARLAQAPAVLNAYWHRL